MNEVINIELEKKKYILWKEQKKKSSLKKMDGWGVKSTIDDDDNSNDDC